MDKYKLKGAKGQSCKLKGVKVKTCTIWKGAKVMFNAANSRVQKYRHMEGAKVQNFKLKGAKLAEECIDTSRLRHKVQSTMFL